MRWSRFAVLVIVATLLQTSLVDVVRWRQTDIKPDLLLILLVFFATHGNRTDVVITSFTIGFAADLIGPTMGLMGPQIISFGLFGTLLSDLNGVVSIRRMPYQAGAILIMGSLTALLSYLLTCLRAEHVAANLPTELFWQPLYSAILGPFLFLPVAWAMRMNRRRPGRGRRRLR